MNPPAPIEAGTPAEKRSEVPTPPATKDLQPAFPMQMPLVRSLGSGRWRLEEDWKFKINGKPFIVPRGFVTDLYSVPWAFTLFLPKDERDNRPSLIHDAGYATCGFRKTAHDDGLTRAQVDLLIFVTALMCGFGWRRALIIYIGVRIGGGKTWDKMKAAGHSLEKPALDR